MRLRIIAFCLTAVVAAMALAQPKPNVAEQAATAHESAMSRYNAKKWNEAAGLFDQFIARYATNEKLPSACLMLAHSRWEMKEYDKADQAADEVIKKFYPSRFWLYAYGTKLIRLRDQKENDKYLDTVEAMVRKAGHVPRRLFGVNAADPQSTWLLRSYDWPWDSAHSSPTAFATDWSADVVTVADTPQRATRALRLLEKMFGGKVDDIPVYWQHAHVCLLRQSGDAAAADKQFKTYIDGWGKDPRAVALYLNHAAYLQAQKDTKAEDAIWDALRKDFAGYGNLDLAMRNRTLALLKAGRHEEFVQYARDFVRWFPINYSTSIDSGYWAAVYDAWFDFARAAAAKGNQGELKNVLIYLDEVDQKNFPRLPNDGLNWRLEAAVTLKDDATATKVAEKLVSDKR